MAQSKAQKRTAAKKVAEAKSQAKKAVRSAKPQAVSGGKAPKGKKSLTAGKKK